MICIYPDISTLCGAGSLWRKLTPKRFWDTQQKSSVFVLTFLSRGSACASMFVLIIDIFVGRRWFRYLCNLNYRLIFLLVSRYNPVMLIIIFFFKVLVQQEWINPVLSLNYYLNIFADADVCISWTNGTVFSIIPMKLCLGFLNYETTFTFFRPSCILR